VKRSTDRILTSHTGALHMPEELQAGIGSSKRLTGLERVPVAGAPMASEVVCTGPIEYVGQDVLARDIDNRKAGLAGLDVEEVFLPVVGPGSVQPYIRNEHYGSDEELFGALAAALRHEYEAIIDAGFICQVDDAFLPWEWDRRLLEDGWDLEEYRRWAALAVDALNAALDGLPEDRLRYRICWRSWNGPHCGLRGRAHPQVAWAKLRALSDGAAIASERLWP
jgi:methionine synthase II (cobalamin-independent)